MICAVIVCSPAGTFSNRYRPWLLTSPPIGVPSTVICAPESGIWTELSRTSPVTVPVFCAAISAAPNPTKASTTAIPVVFRQADFHLKSNIRLTINPPRCIPNRGMLRQLSHAPQAPGRNPDKGQNWQVTREGGCPAAPSHRRRP